MIKDKLKVRPASLGMMIHIIKTTYPISDRDSNEKIAKLIEEEFNVACKANDILQFNHFIEEDYETESRRQREGYGGIA